MKKILRRSTLIYIVALAFIGGLGYLAFELVTGADDWVDQAYITTKQARLSVP